MKKLPPVNGPLGIFTLVLIGLMLLMGASGDPDALLSAFSEVAQSQIAQAGFFFTVAAWLHAGRVKKEIRANFQQLTIAIEQVAVAFREDLKRHREEHREEMDNLTSRVAVLENQNTAQ